MLGKFDRLEALSFQLLKVNRELCVQFNMKDYYLRVNKHLLIYRGDVNQNISGFSRVNKSLKSVTLKALKLLGNILIKLNISPLLFRGLSISLDSLQILANPLNHCVVSNEPNILISLFRVELSACSFRGKSTRSKCIRKLIVLLVH